MIFIQFRYAAAKAKKLARSSGIPKNSKIG